jgi:hypothetical protein
MSASIRLMAPKRGFVSFFNSPYFAHENGQAVDLYCFGSDGLAYSPVDGVVVGKYKVHSPSPMFFKADEDEDLLIIRPAPAADKFIRVLHLSTTPSIGKEVKTGEPLGRLVRSGFFSFWTWRHIHVETRQSENPLRAKGSLPVLPIVKDAKASGTPSEKPPQLRLISANEHYILAEPEEGVVKLGPFSGVGCKVGNNIGIIDAGVPHYGFGGVHLEESAYVKQGDSVKLWGMEVGKVYRCSENVVLFKSKPFQLSVGKTSPFGLSLYMCLSKVSLKLIPPSPNSNHLPQLDSEYLQAAFYQ